MNPTKFSATAFILCGLLLAGFIPTDSPIKIGHQVWMSKNLDSITFSNGEIIPQAQTNEEWEKAGKESKPAWCYYQNDPVNGQHYGKLYNWYAVKDTRRLAPQGWHIPDAAEWQTLIDASGSGELAAGKLKKAGTAYWNHPNAGATDESGFSALPGGYRDNKGGFYTLGNYATFWTASECGRSSAWGRHMSRGDTKVYLNGISKSYGFSVRCIKDPQ